MWIKVDEATISLPDVNIKRAEILHWAVTEFFHFANFSVIKTERVRSFLLRFGNRWKYRKMHLLPSAV